MLPGDFFRLVVQFVSLFLFVEAGRLDQLIDVARRAEVLPVVDDCLDFLLGNPGALETDRSGSVGW